MLHLNMWGNNPTCNNLSGIAKIIDSSELLKDSQKELCFFITHYKSLSCQKLFSSLTKPHQFQGFRLVLLKYQQGVSYC